MEKDEPSDEGSEGVGRSDEVVPPRTPRPPAGKVEETLKLGPSNRK